MKMFILSFYLFVKNNLGKKDTAIVNQGLTYMNKKIC